jgi:hypothetical protein
MSTGRLCEACAVLTGTRGAGIMLMGADVVGAARLGAVDLYRDRPGHRTPQMSVDVSGLVEQA